MTDETIIPQQEPKTGRPSAFREEMIAQAEKLCMLGATDDEIAGFFGVHRTTIYRWKLDNEDFCNALKSGKGQADERIERSLYQRASGHYVTEQVAIKVKVDQYKEEVEIVEVEKWVPPDTTAMIFWLKNRRGDDWRDKREVHVTDDRTEDDIDAAIERRLEKLATGGKAGLPH